MRQQDNVDPQDDRMHPNPNLPNDGTPPPYDSIEEVKRGEEDAEDESYSDHPTPTGGEAVPAYGSIEGVDRGEEEAEDESYTDHPLPNGVDVRTGRPAWRGYDAADLVARVFDARPDEEEGEERGEAAEAAKAKALAPDLDWRDLRHTGWGVVVAEDASEEVRKALEPLRQLREEQVGRACPWLVYRKGESSRRFLARHGMGPGVVDPDKVPYYLLLAGGPEEIPYDVQYQLGVGYGVGRLGFDHVDGYRDYAESVVWAETDGTERSREVELFGVETDGTTRRTLEEMIVPLADHLERDLGGWAVRRTVRSAAVKERLEAALDDGARPGLLVTASHGAVYPHGDAEQVARQGELVCQDWPGPDHPVGAEHTFSALDVPDDADVHGLLCFLFSCFSAGTPERDDFFHERDGEKPVPLAPRSFVAGLPQRLLRAGALAVVGHVDRAWTCTFAFTRDGRQTQTLEAALRLMAAGYPVGHAMNLFGQRYGELAGQVSRVWQAERRDKVEHPDDFLAWLWTAHNDARNLVLLGDPAARFVAEGEV